MNWSGNLEQPVESGQQTPTPHEVKETGNNPIDFGTSQQQTQNAPVYPRQAKVAMQSSHMFPYMQQQAMPAFMQGPNQFMMGTPTGALYNGMPFSPAGMPNVMQHNNAPPGSHTQAQTPSDPNAAFYSFQQNAALHPGFPGNFGVNANGQPFVNAGGPSSSSTTPNNARFNATSIPMSYPMPAYSTSGQTSPYMNANDDMLKNDENLPENNNEGNENARGDPLAQHSLASSIRFQYLRKYRSDQAILKVHTILNEMNVSGGKVKDISFWKKKLDYFFQPTASIRYTSKHTNDVRCFDMSAPMIPVIWAKIGSSKLVKIELAAPQLRAQTLSNGCILFHSPSTTCSYYYPDGSYMTHFIQMKGIFDSSLKIQWLELCAYNFVPGIEWPSLERVLSDKAVSMRIFEKLQNSSSADESGVNFDPESNPDTDPMQELRSNFAVFKNVSHVGLYEEFLRFLQISDIMSALSHLIVYQKKSNIKSPIEALNSYISANAHRATAHNAPADDPTAHLRTPQNDMTAANETATATAATTATANGPRSSKHAPTANNDPATFRVDSISPGCSPRDTMKQTVSEKPATLKRKKSNKNISWPARDYSGSSTPTYEGGDRGIPGTKKIKF